MIDSIHPSGCMDNNDNNHNIENGTVWIFSHQQFLQI